MPAVAAIGPTSILVRTELPSMMKSKESSKGSGSREITGLLSVDRYPASTISEDLDPHPDREALRDVRRSAADFGMQGADWAHLATAFQSLECGIHDATIADHPSVAWYVARQMIPSGESPLEAASTGEPNVEQLLLRFSYQGTHSKVDRQAAPAIEPRSRISSAEIVAIAIV